MTDAPVVAVVGLGYVGLPLAVEFGKRFRTIGYDRSKQRVLDVRGGTDRTGETSAEDLRAAHRLELTAEASALREADFVIVAVPTPVDEANQPDFEPLVSASRAVGANLKPGAVVVYESTVYPGATAEVCVPELEAASGRRWKKDFFVGYSPERINPGDREHTLTRIVKVVSGDTPETLEKVARLYEAVVSAGVHRTSSIEAAEAAKVIENTQRDLNIALMNELAVIFDRLGLDTSEVLAAAGTKWNFLPFRPGLVGGHCIGVDPYYLTYRAEKAGYHPQVILAGRRINDGMAKFIADKIGALAAQAGKALHGAKINLLGLTFKENVPDLRNSKVADLHRELAGCGAELHVHDPMASAEEAQHEYGIALEGWERLPVSDVLVIAVAHQAYRAMPLDRILAKVAPRGCVVDVKGLLDPRAVESAGRAFWRL